MIIEEAGFSEPLHLGRGDHTIIVRLSGGSATLQDGNGTTWDNATKDGSDVVITGNSKFRVTGGLSYRLNVTSYVSPITFEAHRA